MNRLDGKVAFISGAARGIGAATARLMVEAGAKVAIGDVLDERGRETTRSIAGADDVAVFQHLDVTSEGDWAAAIAAAVARFGGLDVLVNNAGLFLGKVHRGGEPRRMAPTLRCQPDRGVSRHQACIAGIARACPAEPAWQRNRQSGLGCRARRLAARPALFDDQGRRDVVHQIGRARIRRKAYRVRVNSIHPGLIQTDMGDQTFVSRVRNLGSNDVDAVRQQAMSRHPIGRLGVPDDIAKGIVFLASDDSGFMTGAGLVVDGGSTAQ